MKQLFSIALLASATFLGLAQVSEANGGLFRRSRGCCESACAPACAPAVPAEVKYEVRTVKVAKHTMKVKEIEVLECRRVVKDVPYTYTVCERVMKDEKRKVMICTPTTREIDATWTVMTPKVVDREITCTTYKCERVMITEKVPVCRVVCVTYVDECGRCCTKRERVTEYCERTRCVIQRTPITETKMVKVTICVPEVVKGKRTICENVISYKDITVQVCSLVKKEMTGTRQVCETVTEKVKRKVQYCETTWEETTVRVPVCSTSCSSECGPRRGGLFRRSCGSGCCN